MKLSEWSAVLAWPGWKAPLGFRCVSAPLAGTWEQWDCLAGAWDQIRREYEQKKQAVMSGLVGWFGYDGSFVFLPCHSVGWLQDDEENFTWSDPGPMCGDNWETGADEEVFCRMVKQAQEWIRRGHIYQVNLARELKRRWEGEAEDLALLFRYLWRGTRAPCAGMILTPHQALVGASPEIFLEIQGRRIKSVPIKGTRPRCSDPAQDQRMAAELRAHPKEVAELVMITDLMRHDLGQVCQFGSVEVTELVQHKALSHVFHAYSTVEGDLRLEVAPLEAVRVCFPGGSVTGAPKKRAREIIAELEPVERGLYTGAYGWLAADGSVRLAMTIRSFVIDGSWIRFHVGSGITAESDPRAEFEETCHKARALWQAWELFARRA